MGKPDMVLVAPSENKIPAEGYVPYKFVVMKEIFEKDTWVEGVQIVSSNPKVMHHANLFWNRVRTPFSTEGFITAQVPGGDVMRLAEGTAFLIPKNSFLCLSIHYVTTGKQETDRISVGLRFAKGKVQRRLRHLMVGDTSFRIPPLAPAHRVMAEKALPVNATGIWLYPHMHLRGRDMTMSAVHEDGREEILLRVPNYSFDWQASYRWAPGTVHFPKGTRIRCVAHYDNSRFNSYNPDAEMTVTYGFDTFHEMLYGFLAYTATDEQLGLDVDPETGHLRQ
jgi:hypothetical protein